MWIYERQLQYPVKIKNPNPLYAKIVAAQLGGPHGELGAAMRYLNQRYSTKNRKVVGILTDICTEELGQMEMISALMHQLTRTMSQEEIIKAGFEGYFINHTAGVYPADTSGVPFDTKYIASNGDALADIHEDLAAEQKARLAYDNILRLVDDPDVCDVIKFLRERELVHYQRFGDALRLTQDDLDSQNFYGWNPDFDRGFVKGKKCK